MHLPRQPHTAVGDRRRRNGCHGRCFADELKALRAARPVLAVGDDTHTTPRATPLRSHPLAALPVPGRGVVSLARHVARAVLGCVRPASAVPSAVALVAVAGVALAHHHRLAAAVIPSSVTPQDLKMSVLFEQAPRQRRYESSWKMFEHAGETELHPWQQVPCPQSVRLPSQARNSRFQRIARVAVWAGH